LKKIETTINQNFDENFSGYLFVKWNQPYFDVIKKEKKEFQNF